MGGGGGATPKQYKGKNITLAKVLQEVDSIASAKQTLEAAQAKDGSVVHMVEPRTQGGGGGKDNEGQKLLESEPIWLPMTGDGGPWTHCDAECGWKFPNNFFYAQTRTFELTLERRHCPKPEDILFNLVLLHS